MFKMLGVEFIQIDPEVNEEFEKDSAVDPSEVALLLAEKKLSNVTKKYDFKEEDVVITADTIVSTDSKILGKPRDRLEAKTFLKMLSGTWHKVTTAVCILNSNTIEKFVEETEVKFRRLPEKVLEAYIQTKEPFDKAGGYAIQGFGGLFIEKINGDFYNVIGLPIGKIFEIFLAKGWLDGTEFSIIAKRKVAEIWRKEFEQR